MNLPKHKIFDEYRKIVHWDGIVKWQSQNILNELILEIKPDLSLKEYIEAQQFLFMNVETTRDTDYYGNEYGYDTEISYSVNLKELYTFLTGEAV